MDIGRIVCEVEARPMQQPDIAEADTRPEPAEQGARPGPDASGTA